jgi:hypothetical protein
MNTPRAGDADLRRQRSSVMRWVLLAAPVTVALWLGIYYLLPPLAGMDEPLARLFFAINCCCVAILLCFVTGIEAVAHERLQSPAIDPLAGYKTRRLRINLRYLQHTLEQLLVFVPGLLGLAFYCADGSTMRAVVATTVTWIVGRFGFWIGYHYGSRYRAIGAPGMAQSMIVLLYVCARFGHDVAGFAGAIAPLVLFGGIEAYLFHATRSSAGRGGADIGSETRPTGPAH